MFPAKEIGDPLNQRVVGSSPTRRSKVGRPAHHPPAIAQRWSALADDARRPDFQAPPAAHYANVARVRISGIAPPIAQDDGERYEVGHFIHGPGTGAGKTHMLIRQVGNSLFEGLEECLRLRLLKRVKVEESFELPKSPPTLLVKTP